MKLDVELLLLPIAVVLMVLSAAYLFSKFWDWDMNRQPRLHKPECLRCGLVEQEAIHHVDPGKGGHLFERGSHDY